MTAQPSPQLDPAALVNISQQIWPPHLLRLAHSNRPNPANASLSLASAPAKGVMDLGDKRTMEFAISAREINNDSGEGSSL